VREAILKRAFIVFLLTAFIQIGCSGSKSKEVSLSPEVKSIQELMVKGSYDEALKITKDILTKVPVSMDLPIALYLEGYILAFDKSDLQNCRPPLRKLLEEYPQSTYVIPSQKLIADTQYWQGHYGGAIEEYRKLESMGDSSFDLYSKLQIGNCLLLEDKVGDALTYYRELIEKNPGTTIADSAQLMTANAYLKLQNVSQAKKELKKLIAQSQNHDIQESAQKALRQIEEDASLGQNTQVSN
jgi:outer membrane protein assembly factor BamD (BamD/ComL family)